MNVSRNDKYGWLYNVYKRFDIKQLVSWCGINFAVRHFFFFFLGSGQKTMTQPKMIFPDSLRLCKIISSTSSLEKIGRYNVTYA